MNPATLASQQISDEAFVKACEDAKASGCRTWPEVAKKLGYSTMTAFFRRRSRTEKRLNKLIPSPSGWHAPNGKRHAAEPVDVKLAADGSTVEGLKLRGTSTLIREDGSTALQWVKTNRDQEALDAYYRNLATSMAAKLPRAAPIKRSGSKTRAELMACYPIGDAHIGMLSWGAETGENWDLKIAQQIQVGAMTALVQQAPPADSATVISLGDWFHYDSMAAVTPASRHILDADSRYGKMLPIGIAVMRACIEQALRKHRRVRVICAQGNHDETTSQALAHCIAGTYERNMRVVVDTNPSVFHYFQHGRVLVGIHHGHKAKPERLAGVMAADRPSSGAIQPAATGGSGMCTTSA
jgi:hypothetical protein